MLWQREDEIIVNLSSSNSVYTFRPTPLSILGAIQGAQASSLPRSCICDTALPRPSRHMSQLRVMGEKSTQGGCCEYVTS